MHHREAVIKDRTMRRYAPFGRRPLDLPALRLVLGAYIFAALVYVNANGNWNKDDDPG